MGLGTVKNTTELTNRDVNSTQEITRDQTTGMLNGSVTVDHRLLSESGRAEIVQQQKDLPLHTLQATKNVIAALPDGQYKTDALNSLNNMQAKVAILPPDMQTAGQAMIDAYPEFIKKGGNPLHFKQMLDNPAVLDLVKNSTELSEKVNEQKQQLIAQGLTESEAIQQLLTRRPNTQPAEVVPSQPEPDDDGSGLHLEIVKGFEGTLLPHANSNKATISGQKTVEVEDGSNLGISLFSNVGSIKQQIDKTIAASGVPKEEAELALSTVLLGSAGVAKSLVSNYAFNAVAGEKVQQITDNFTNGVTDLLHSAPKGTTANLTGEQNRQNVASNGNVTAQQLADQLQQTKDGVGVLTSAVLGAAVSKITKVEGKETETGTSGIGSRDEFTKPYDPVQTRNDLEAVHGAENVKSTTVVNDPYQRVNSNPDKGIEVIYDTYGNKAVRVEYKDPRTGETKFANAAYDDRTLPIFDDYAKYTTKIQKPDGYESLSNAQRRREEMKLATNDLKQQI
ncbi:phosphoglycerate kinase [Acinetobacter nosocomialis]|uniref:phosphoglycerate kinase n=2 Tax=Acinetobacter nosocomialis TaxID=106654 RepID=UPI0024DE1D7D|nr:phosphoglycerate kinase [Acinetobacter nosocomialis]